MNEPEGATIANTSETHAQNFRSTRFVGMLAGYVLVTMICGGATCAKNRSMLPEFNPPPVFTAGTPSLSELIQTTNRSLAVNSVSSNSLTIKSPDFRYPLSGNFRWERPDNFRLESKLLSSALGVHLAAGSNPNLFWMQVSRPSPTIYYARHDEFENQIGGRHVLPVSPLWLREAFGIIELDPEGQHEGPTTRADGKLEVVSHIPSPRGAYRRTLTLAPTTGTIEETRLYDSSNKLIAIAQMRQHQYYSAINWSLPHQVQIQLMPDVGEPINFTIDVAFYQTNDAAPPNSFVFPDTTGLTAVDLVRYNESIQSELYGVQNLGANGTVDGNALISPNLSNDPSSLLRQDSVPTTPDALPWQVNTTPPQSQPLDPSAARTSAVTNPIYRTAAQPAGQTWQGNMR